MFYLFTGRDILCVQSIVNCSWRIPSWTIRSSKFTISYTQLCIYFRYQLLLLIQYICVSKRNLLKEPFKDSPSRHHTTIDYLLNVKISIKKNLLLLKNYPSIIYSINTVTVINLLLFNYLITIIIHDNYFIYYYFYYWIVQLPGLNQWFDENRLMLHHCFTMFTFYYIWYANTLFYK